MRAIVEAHADADSIPRESGGQSFHLVQVSFDESILQPGSATDTVRRQIQYLRDLQILASEAHITILILTFNPAAKGFHKDGVAFIPVPYRRRFQIPNRLFKALDELHHRDPISMVTTQSVQEDGLGALIFRKLRGVPVTGQIHIDIFHPAARRENFGRAPWRWLMSPIAFWSLGKYDALRVVGSRIQKRLEERKLPGRTYLVPVAMPLMSRPYDSSIEPSHKVLFVGRLEHQKRLDLWMKIAAEIAGRDPAARFEIAGEGSLHQDLERQAKELGLQEKVKFLGNVPYEALPALYASAKVFMITSSYEGFGRVVAEAMHFNVPVVAYRITGIEDIVEDGKTGFLRGFGDIQELASCVLRILEDRGLRETMGAAARTSVDTAFDPDRLSREWMRQLHSTVRPVEYKESSFVKARRPTLERWRSLSGMKYSLLRTLEYEAIQGLRLEGRTLDIGGGERNSYYSLLDFRGQVESANIDSGMRPTYLADLNKPLELPTGEYDNVISFNTFEHIYRDEIAIREAIRVLKPGGRLFFTVPFLYKVHGSPSDHSRHTAFWWFQYLTSLGIKPANLSIEPFVWSPLSSALSLIDFNNRPWLRKLVMLAPLISFKHGRGERVPHRQFDEFALGYYICATK